MDGIQHFNTFLIAGILLNLTPGNDTIFILSRSVAQGSKAGLLSSLGIASGSIVHTFLAAIGLSLIISQSVFLFTLIKYLGAGYIIFIGIKMFLNKRSLILEESSGSATFNSRRIYFEAVLTNILNPKVALFFIAFLPQFIVADQETTMLPFIILGLTFTLTGTCWGITLAYFSSYLFTSLRKRNRISIILNRVCGTVLVGLGLKILWTK